MADRLPTRAERFARVRARADSKAPPPTPLATKPVARPPRRPRHRPPRAPTTAPAPLALPDHLVPMTWEALFAGGLEIRLARRGKKSIQAVTRAHARDVRAAARLVARLPAERDFERRKAWELHRHARSTLPSAETAREALIAAARVFPRTAEVFAGYAAAEADRFAATWLRRLMAAPNTLAALGHLDRPRRPAGYVNQGLRQFVDDMTADPDRRGFPGDVPAALRVAAACGVVPVGRKSQSRP
jgi:hypothetical protein